MYSDNRRSFLKRLGQAGLAGVMSRLVPGPIPALADEVTGPATYPATRPGEGPIAEAAKSIVIDHYNSMVLAGRQIHENALLGMIEKSVCLVTDQTEISDAWAAMFKADDIIGIKFDEVGYETLDTTDTLAAQLVRSLEQSGFKRDRIVLIDVPTALARELKTHPRNFGWQDKAISFGSGSERLAAVLDQVTAIINVPFLKTDNLSGICGCLKNISLPFLYRQSPYLRNGCSPYIADVVALPQIRSKLRLNIVNGLRAVYDKGPAVHAATIWHRHGLIVSKDPVAADHISLNCLDEYRLTKKLPPIGDRMGRLPHIHDAAQRKLGTDDPDYIKLVKPNQT